MDKLKNFASGIKSKLTKSDLQKLLDLALKSNDPPSISVYYSIGDKTQQPEDIKLILKVISDYLSPNSKDPSKILKALLLSEALISLSSSSFLQDIRQCIVKFKHFAEYNPEDKSIELIGIIRKTSQKLVYLLENEAVLQELRQQSLNAKQRSTSIQPVVEKIEENVQEKRNNNKEAIFLESSNRNWYESAKVNLDISEDYKPPQFSENEKKLFIRTVPEEPQPKANLFSGLKTRPDTIQSKLNTSKPDTVQSKLNTSKTESRFQNFDIFSQGVNKEEPKEPKTQTQNLNEIKVQAKPDNKSLFGVPMKARYIKEDTKENSEKKDFVEKVNQVGSAADSNKIMFDLLTLDFSNSSVPNKKETKEQAIITQEIGKSENSNTVKPKSEMGSVCAGYNHLAFDAEFPLIFKEETKPSQKVNFNNLEQSLVNLDDLDLSLSKSLKPRRLF